MIDITIKLVSEESVKMFDKLAIKPLRILLGVTDDQRGFPHPLFSVFNISIELIIKLSHLQGSRLTACGKRQLVLDTLLQNVALLVLN
jgi:hypothetical protein